MTVCPKFALAFLWHQHQPYYPDDVAGENPMPWVRLHGVKDYYGMALHLLEFPEMRCTINLVPSLVTQLQAYTEHGATDQCLIVSRKPAGSLSEQDSLFLLDHFFMANPEHMILPHPRYGELYGRRGLGRNTAQEALRRFQQRDLRDLQVWFNLAWIHPLVFERDAELEELRRKGRFFTEEEKNRLLDKHLELLRAIIPLHRQLADRGQVELSTTPFFHPILPLLLDKKLAREAMPDVKLPRYTGGYPEDAAVHLRRAIEHHSTTFGAPPRGMWPAEGSVCQAMIPMVAEHGIRWIATDEEILSASTHGFVSRDERGHVRNPDQMYRPYKCVEAGAELGIVFRDHGLSDRIGFHYQRTDPAAAAEDFVHHLQEIGKAVTGPQPALVNVILDGENCWEHYPGGGVAFLRSLYKNCVSGRAIRPVKIGDFLQEHPPRKLAAALCRQLDQPRLCHLDRPFGRQHGLGSLASSPRAPARPLPARTHPARSHPAGVGRTVYCGGQRLVLVVRRRSLVRRMRSSTICFASTCRISTGSLATRHPPNSAGRSAGAANVRFIRCRGHFST